VGLAENDGGTTLAPMLRAHACTARLMTYIKLCYLFRPNWYWNELCV